MWTQRCRHLGLIRLGCTAICWSEKPRARQIAGAPRRYAGLVAAARDVVLWDGALRQQIFLGDDDFVARIQPGSSPLGRGASTPPCTRRTQQRHIKRSLDQWLKECATREQALWSAYTRSGLRMTEMAQLMGLSVSRVSWLIGAEEARQQIAPSRK